MDKRMSTVIKPSAGFQYSVNIQYDLENEKKLNSYIPLKQNVELLQTVIASLHPQRNDRSRLIIGSYGTGKSHFCAVLLALLSRPKGLSTEFYESMAERFGKVDPLIESEIQREIKQPPFFPVVVSGAVKSFEQAILNALAKALQEAGINDCFPETAFKAALNQVQTWESQYPEALKLFSAELTKYNFTLPAWKNRMEAFEDESIKLFETIYPAVTRGADFQHIFHGDASTVYQSVSAALQARNYRGIYMIFDEFGSYLEGQWQNNNGANLRKVQDFAEACNASADRMVYAMFVTHKPISQYASQYGQDVINEWRKIEGRFTLHELHNTSSSSYELIARVIEKEPPYWTGFCENHLTDFQILQEKLMSTQLFSDMLVPEFMTHVLYGAYPLHPVTTFCLPRFSSQVAQNERTIFTFLSTSDYFSLGQFLNAETLDKFSLLTIDRLYDYFEPQLRAADAEDRIKRIWFSTKEALTRLKPEEEDEASLLKAIGVLRVLGMPAVLPISQDSLQLSFWNTELHGARYDHAIKVLLNKGIVFEGGNTGTLELVDPGEIRLDEEVPIRIDRRKAQFSLLNFINERYRPQYVLAKKYNEFYNMTRYFFAQYLTVTEALRIIKLDLSAGVPGRDGMVYYVLPQKGETWEELKNLLKERQNKRHVWILPRANNLDKMCKVDDCLREIDALQSLLHDIDTSKRPQKADRLLILLWIRERESEARGQIGEIFKWEDVDAFPRLAGQDVRSKADLSRLVSDQCFSSFNDTPKWNNEMINKNRLSRPIVMARQKVVRGLLRPNLEKDLGLTGSGPDMSIYRSLLRFTRIVVEKEEEEITRLNSFADIMDPAIYKIMNALRNILDKSDENGVGFSQILQMLQSPPFGLRAGIIPILLAIYLHQNRNELVLVNASGEEIAWTAEQIDAAMIAPENYTIQRFNWSNEKSLLCDLLQKLFWEYSDVDDVSGLSRRVVNMMKRWLLALPRYSRDTRNVSEKTREYRRLLKQWNISSGQLLFVELPKIFGEEIRDEASVRNFVESMQVAKTEIDGHYHTAIQNLEKHLISLVPEGFRELQLLSSLKKWLGAMSEQQCSHLYSDSTQELLYTIRNFAGENYQEFSKQLFSRLAGARTEDWNDGTTSIVCEQFAFAIDEVESQLVSGSTSDLQNEFRLTYIDEEGVRVDRTFVKTNISPTAEILETVLASHLQEFGDAISKHEKCEILARLLQSIVK